MLRVRTNIKESSVWIERQDEVGSWLNVFYKTTVTDVIIFNNIVKVEYDVDWGSRTAKFNLITGEKLN